MENYQLQVTETNSKAGKFHYQVIDETGAVISERKSNREYAACTAGGAFYFGRLDLIGKGDHGKMLKDAAMCLRISKEKFESMYTCRAEDFTYEAFKNQAQARLDAYSKIAYIKQ